MFAPLILSLVLAVQSVPAQTTQLPPPPPPVPAAVTPPVEVAAPDTRPYVALKTDAGTIDSKIATQLREARRAILTEEQIALGDEELLNPPAQAS